MTPDSEAPAAENGTLTAENKPADRSDTTRRRLTPLTANRAMAVYIVVTFVTQLVLLAVLHVSIGVTLLVGGALTLAAYALLFPDAFRELRAHPRWRTRPDVLTVLGALALGFVASRGASAFLQAVFPGASKALQQYNGIFTADSGGALWILLSGGLLIPFVEELAFRGFGLTGYERRLSPFLAALFTSVLFALMHGAPAQVFAILPLSWVIARVVQYTGSFWSGFAVHAANNTFSLAVALLILGNPTLAKASVEAASKPLPIAAGLMGLAMAAVSLWGASVWLRPRNVPPSTPGPVWSASLTVPLLWFAVAAFGASVGSLVRNWLPQ